MVYLTVGVVIAVILTLVNMLLVFGVIRRLKELQGRLESQRQAPDAGLPAGTPAPELTASTVAGAEVASVDPAKTTLIGFFSPGCGPCSERIPEFVKYAETGGVAAVAVVVTDNPDDGDEYVRRLAAVDVTVQSAQGEWNQGFNVSSYPTLTLVGPDGVVVGSGNMFSELPTLSAV